MYTRPIPPTSSERTEPRGLQIPPHYSGNAFREPPLPPPMEPMPDEETELHESASPSEIPPEETSLPVSAKRGGKGLRFDFKHLFSGGIGTEELLILGVLLLLSPGEDNDDILLFLILLLFIH